MLLNIKKIIIKAHHNIKIKLKTKTLIQNISKYYNCK